MSNPPTTSLVSGRQCYGQYGHGQGYFTTTVKLKLHLVVQHTADRAGTFSLWSFEGAHYQGDGDHLIARRVWEFSQPQNWISGTYTHDIAVAPWNYAFYTGRTGCTTD